MLDRKQLDLTINTTMRLEVIEGLIEKINAYYIFPEIAKKMEKGIRTRLEGRKYDSITSAADLCKTLTEHLQEISHDKHLSVIYSYEPRPISDDEAGPGPQEREKWHRIARLTNFEFEKVERLGGNIGYLDFRGFMPPELAAETAIGAMGFLANTSALIIDLRHNGGGSPAMVAFMCSYFFDAEPVHLNDLYHRLSDLTHQWWTLPYIPGKRYVDKAVYLLTSHHTFSGAEEFAYNLKNLKRAILIGETTGGGAHPTGGYQINEHFVVGVPNGRAINPITGTNWEGTGVMPDIEVPAELALETAHLTALEKLLETNTNDLLTGELHEIIETVRTKLEAMKSSAV
ncbi:MAG: S41 family peptidase [Cyanobacteria bacterium P01_D01_bin.56]